MYLLQYSSLENHKWLFDNNKDKWLKIKDEKIKYEKIKDEKIYLFYFCLIKYER